MNEEYPIQVKKDRDRLRLVFQMIKSNPKYREKCNLRGDKLMVDGVKYTVDNLGDLPIELAAYQATEKCNHTTLVFHGEWSPFSNFHPNPFLVDGILYNSAEHYIQYQKLLLFGDSVTANQILRSQTPIEAKQLSYSISNFSMSKWTNKGYKPCAKGIREKFVQNKPLLEMLKGTGSLMLAEASKDKLWGTGVPLRNSNALSTSNWENPGWLSKILTSI